MSDFEIGDISVSQAETDNISHSHAVTSCMFGGGGGVSVCCDILHVWWWCQCVL